MINAASTERCYTLSQTEADKITDSMQKNSTLKSYFRQVMHTFIWVIMSSDVTVVDANCCSKSRSHTLMSISECSLECLLECPLVGLALEFRNSMSYRKKKSYQRYYLIRKEYMSFSHCLLVKQWHLLLVYGDVLSNPVPMKPRLRKADHDQVPLLTGTCEKLWQQVFQSFHIPAVLMVPLSVLPREVLDKRLLEQETQRSSPTIEVYHIQGHLKTLKFHLS